ncbi:MAG: hypothetical protein J7639_20195 [Paenibacillaceae bacterium]|nr:hypothetical protein [Paenibacillaceae bacterium]
MTSRIQAITDKWTDDHLDLLNYAIQIGDREWQQELIGMLRERQQHVQAEWRGIRERELWRKYEAINRKMLVLFAQMRDSANQIETRVLQDELWELKIERIRIAKQLRAA